MLVSSYVPERLSRKRFSREVSADRLLIRRRWGSTWQGGLLLLVALVLVGLVIRGDLSLGGESPVPEWLPPFLACIFAAALAYGAGAVMFNATDLEVTRDRLRISNGPLPWGGETQLGSAGIKVVSYREDAQDGYDTRYDVVVVTAEGEFSLFGAMTDYEVVIFYVQALREFLQLPDRRMVPLI
jgi:hypothetical protein